MSGNLFDDAEWSERVSEAFGATADTTTAPVVAQPVTEPAPPDDADDDGRDLEADDDGPIELGEGTLESKFGFPPFTVLDARQGSWQARKKLWLKLGLASEKTRDDVLGNFKSIGAYAGEYQAQADALYAESARAAAAGDHDAARAAAEQAKRIEGRVASTPKAVAVSVFDPVLCELAIRWFTPPGGHVLDPFAGGSVRGVVTAVCGRRYTGFDLREEQVAANREQWNLLRARAAPPPGTPDPAWWTGDSRILLDGVEADSVDAVFTCPPYADLERYSNDPADLSTMTPAAFTEAYEAIIRGAVKAMKPDSFAFWVIGNIRDARGHIRDLTGETIAAFRRAGAALYNDAVLVTMLGTAPMRAKQFARTRVLIRSHQAVLVFLKGDRRRARARCGDIGGFPGLAWDAKQEGFGW